MGGHVAMLLLSLSGACTEWCGRHIGVVGSYGFCGLRVHCTELEQENKQGLVMDDSTE